jgi:hypothetical protein
MLCPGIYRSSVPLNCWLNVNWLWEANFNPLAALEQIVGVEQRIQAIQSETS